MARILVVGGSLGGLLVANVLHRSGHDITLWEKVRGPMDGRGAGIVTHDALFTALRRAGLDSTDGLGVEVAERVVLDASGEAIATRDMPQVLTSWSRLYELLHRLFPAGAYLQGVSAVAVDGTTADSARARGRSEQGDVAWKGDLVIASDGIRSSVRQQLAPTAQPAYAGYVAWRGVCDEGLLSQRTLDTLFERFGFCLPPGEQIIGYPVAGQNNDTRPGRRAYNFVWYRGAGDAVLADLLTDDSGTLHRGGIAPGKVAARHVAAMRRAAQELLAPQFAEVIDKTAQSFFQPIYDLESPQLAYGRVALMGDAAFVARPHVGMGVTKAAQDAVALGDCIAHHGATPAALQAYQDERMQACRSVVRRSRWLGEYMQAQTQGSAFQATRSAGNVMSETAIDLDRYGHASGFDAAAAGC